MKNSVCRVGARKPIFAPSVGSAASPSVSEPVPSVCAAVVVAVGESIVQPARAAVAIIEPQITAANNFFIKIPPGYLMVSS